jgi:hypothetical protein
MTNFFGDADLQGGARFVLFATLTKFAIDEICY